MKIGLVIAGIALAGSAAQASTTSFNIGTGGSGEPSLKTIFGNIYGGAFNPVVPGSKNYSNGTVTLTRVDDYFNSLTSTGQQYLNGSTFGTADDNVWSDGTAMLQFDAKYAGNNNTMGWYDNTTNGSIFHPLLGSVPGSSVVTMLSSNFEWGLKSQSGSDTDYWRSNRFANAGNEDHMVSYRVTGVAGGPRWLLAWEDLPLDSSDTDYNDWVGEVSMVTVPLPGSAWMGLAGLGGIVGLRLARRRG